ncbi:MAG: ABC transporter permease [Candidatus Syntrophonatronum acetioxidans]|uniref:ABC transporter permease n=1 Tax=Candidatus Syntrophonatronum acetioxidans TaxID=1795816 RepID=A0A424YIH3_9FIRM|nr:MAG: ABC transporter permease [Candidatus Syntrophonatronum acetioxidans]
MILNKKVRKNKMFIFSLLIITGLFLMALFAPHLASHDPLKTETANWLTPPGPDNWFGTDRLGRDIYSRVVFGSRISLSIGFLSAGLMIFTGTLLGSLAGYYGGRVDSLIMRFTDIVIVFPALFLIITLVSLFDTGFMHIVLIIGFTGWTVVARLVRAEFMSLRERDFVQAIKSLGASDFRVITRHMLPNALGPIVVAATLSVPAAILAEAGLSFLGLGIPAPVPTWGNILREAHGYLRQAWWYAAFPGFFIFFTVMAFNLLGESLKDLLDS